MAVVERALVSEKVLLQQFNPSLVLLCPTLDLVATVVAEHTLEVFRLDGQRAFRHRRSNNEKISHFCWRNDGAALLVHWTDRILISFNADTGHISNELSLTDIATNSPASYVCWPLNFLYEPPAQSNGTTFPFNTKKFSIDDILDRDANIDLSNTVDQLQKALANIHIEDELPRLGTVPFEEDYVLIEKGIVPDEQHHSSVADTLAKWSAESDHFALMMIFNTDGTASFANNLCKFGCQTIAPGQRIVAHSTYPLFEQHALLLQPNSANQTQAQAPLTLRVLNTNTLALASIYHNPLLHCLGRFNLLTTYITQSLVLARAGWRTASHLPRRFLAMNDTLDDMDVQTALYHVAMTGHAYPATREWIVEEVGAAGIKRWREAVVKGLHMVIDAVVVYLIPALDRATVVTCRLRALSRIPRLLGLIPSRNAINHTVADLHNLRLLAHKTLLYARAELAEAETFLDWLTHIHTVLSDSTSSAADDSAKVLANLDIAQLTSYITGALGRSHLRIFLEHASAAVLAAPIGPEHHVERETLLAILARHKSQRLMPAAHVVEAVNLLYQGRMLAASVEDVIQPIFKALREGMRVSDPVLLETEVISEVQAVRSVFSEGKGEDGGLVHYALSVPDVGRNRVLVHRVTGKELSKATYALYLGRGEVEDVAFVDDCMFVVLLRTPDASYLLRFSYRTTETPWSTGKGSVVNVSSLTPHITLSFPHPKGEGDFVPLFVKVNGRKGRRKILIGENDLLRYRVYELDPAK